MVERSPFGRRPIAGIYAACTLPQVVLSTNIAESSITIPDVVFVIDCGLMKEKTYNATHSAGTLECNCVSQVCLGLALWLGLKEQDVVQTGGGFTESIFLQTPPPPVPRDLGSKCLPLWSQMVFSGGRGVRWKRRVNWNVGPATCGQVSSGGSFCCILLFVFNGPAPLTHVTPSGQPP